MYTVLHNSNLAIHWFWTKALKLHCFLKKKKSSSVHRYKPHKVRFWAARFFSGTKKPCISRPCCIANQSKTSPNLIFFCINMFPCKTSICINIRTIWFFLVKSSAHNTTGSANTARTSESDRDPLSVSTPATNAPSSATSPTPVVEKG